MSLDFSLKAMRKVEVYSGNITHNLSRMAEAVGIYKCLWRPEEIGITTASQMIEPLRETLKKLKENPAEYEKYNVENGWGLYENFVSYVEEVLKACEENPDAEVEASR